VLTGGANDDTYLYTNGDGADTILDAGSTTGTDTLSITGYASTAAVYTRVGNSDDVRVTFTGTTTDSVLVQRGLEGGANTLEQITFTSGGTKAVATLRTELLAKQATTGNDVITGFTGVANTIKGAAGNDTLTGQALADKLQGEAGNDTLSGGGGKDTVVGGLNIDVLTGGLDADRFEFTKGDIVAGTNADHITDFSRSQGDKIALLGYGLAASGFKGTGTMASGGAIEFGYAKVAAGNYTLIKIDSDNNGTSDQEIRLDNMQLDLLVSDFTFL
jgi:Ca2+-binding RTX toxin-like protein